MNIKPKQIDLTRDLVMTGGSIRLVSGSAASPSLRFVDHSNTGIYLASAAKIGFSTSGVQRVTINTASVNSSIQIRALDGNVTAPAYSFTNSTNSGLFWNDQWQVLTLAAKGWDAINVFGEGTVHMNGNGALALQEGNTSQRPANALNGMIRYNNEIGKFEFYHSNTWTNVGTVTEVRSGTGLAGGAIRGTGELSLAGAPLSLFNLTNTGLLVRNNFGSVIARSLATASSARIVIANPSGNGGDPTVDLATTGVVNGSYTRLTVDAYGRVTAGSQLASSDITTALGYTPLNPANVPPVTPNNTANSIVQRDASGNFAANSITSSLNGNAASASTLQTARTITLSNHAAASGSFNGSADLNLSLTLAPTGVTAGTYNRVTVDIYGRVTSGVVGTGGILEANTWYAAEYENPNNAGWPVNSLAPAYLDPDNNSLTVRGFDDSTEEGVGLMEMVPTGATTVTFILTGRPTAVPSSNSNRVLFNLRSRKLAIGSAMPAWGSAWALNAMTLNTVNTFYQQFTQTVNIGSIALTAGDVYQFEFTRNAAASGDNLVGDFMLLSMRWVWQ